MKQKRLRWFGYVVRRAEDVEGVGLKNRIKRCRPVKQWIDAIVKDMRKRGVVRHDTGDRDGCRRAVKGLAKTR